MTDLFRMIFVSALSAAVEAGESCRSVAARFGVAVSSV